MPQSSMPKQYSPQLLLINSAVAMGKIGMLTRSPAAPGIVRKGSGEQSVGLEWVGSGGINKPSGSDGLALWTNIYLAPDTSTWLFLIPLQLVFLPQLQKRHTEPGERKPCILQVSL